MQFVPPFDLLLSYPQWQGSGRNEHLVRGSRAATKLLSLQAPLEIVPLSDLDDGAYRINRFDAVMAQMVAAQRVLARRSPDRLLTIGGDCAVDIPVIDYLVGRYPDLTVIWIDSHFDANTPDTSPSGNLHGMPVAVIMGAAPEKMRSKLHHPLPPAQFRYVWANVADDGDRRFQRDQNLRWLDDQEIVSGPVHIHFDLDVLNPEEFPHLAYPEANGMSIEGAETLLRHLARDADIVGLTFTEFAPADDVAAAAGTNTIAALYAALLGSSARAAMAQI